MPHLNAEALFTKTVKDCAMHTPMHRCIYLRTSQIKADRDIWLPEILNILKTVFYTNDDDIYMCHDHDIFVMGRSWSTKSINELTTHITPELTSALPPELTSLFEIGVDAGRIKSICEAKIDAHKIKRAKANAKKKEGIQSVSRSEAIQTLDRDLISSLAMRREMRKTIEIMVVEDDPFSQKLVQNALKKFSVSMTADGQGAIMNYINKAPDVLFLDIGLPDIDGHEVLRQLFKLDPSAYVIMFSGNGDKENVMKAIELGAKGFVGKPFTQDKLFQYIDKSPFIQAKQQENQNGHSIR